MNGLFFLILLGATAAQAADPRPPLHRYQCQLPPGCEKALQRSIGGMNLGSQLHWSLGRACGGENCKDKYSFENAYVETIGEEGADDFMTTVELRNVECKTFPGIVLRRETKKSYRGPGSEWGETRWKKESWWKPILSRSATVEFKGAGCTQASVRTGDDKVITAGDCASWRKPEGVDAATFTEACMAAWGAAGPELDPVAVPSARPPVPRLRTSVTDIDLLALRPPRPDCPPSRYLLATGAPVPAERVQELKALALKLSSADEQARYVAISGLTGKPGIETLARIARWDSREEVSVEAIRRLGNIGVGTSPFAGAATDALLALDGKALAPEAHGEWAQQLGGMLEIGKRTARGRELHAQVVERLLASVNEPHPRVRLGVMYGIVEVMKKRASPQLIGAVDRILASGNSEETREKLVMGLAGMFGVASVETRIWMQERFTVLARDPNPRVAFWASTALRRMSGAPAGTDFH